MHHALDFYMPSEEEVRAAYGVEEEDHWTPELLYKLRTLEARKRMAAADSKWQVFEQEHSGRAENFNAAVMAGGSAEGRRSRQRKQQTRRLRRLQRRQRQRRGTRKA